MGRRRRAAHRSPRAGRGLSERTSTVNSWIDFSALVKIVLGGLICGAGLPALFAIGLRALHIGAPAEGASSERVVGGNPAGMAIAGICFAVVLAAIGYGIYLIVSSAS